MLYIYVFLSKVLSVSRGTPTDMFQIGHVQNPVKEIEKIPIYCNYRDMKPRKPNILKKDELIYHILVHLKSQK